MAENAGSADSLVFVAPVPSLANYWLYQKQVYASAQRIVYAFYRRFPRALPFRVAFYPAWDQVHPLWVPFKGIRAQVNTLNKFGHTSPLILPFGSLFRDFDTQTLLQRTASKIVS